MATILEGLNQISAKLGGPADATNNAEAVANIADHASGGSGGGGGDVVLVPFSDESYAVGSTSGYVSQKTFAEIKQILDSGKAALARCPDASGMKGTIYSFVAKVAEFDGVPSYIKLDNNTEASYIPESVSAEYAGRVLIEAK